MIHVVPHRIGIFLFLVTYRADRQCPGHAFAIADSPSCRYPCLSILSCSLPGESEMTSKLVVRLILAGLSGIASSSANEGMDKFGSVFAPTRGRCRVYDG